MDWAGHGWAERQPLRRAIARLGSCFSHTALPDAVEVGRHTYGYDEHTFPMFTEGARIVVGGFCSFSPEVRVLGGGEHARGRASTFPFNARMFDREGRNAPDAIDKGPTVIGNDVWIGLGALILPGVTIGDGAIVGAGAIVTQSIPPYAVAVGNPATVVHYRFSSEICERLLAVRWWDWDDATIRERADWFMSDIEVFLDRAERRAVDVVPPRRRVSTRPTERSHATRSLDNLRRNGSQRGEHREVDQARQHYLGHGANR
jgi:acetyltransferase-like isoleucine patch superfamily enzyme